VSTNTLSIAFTAVAPTTILCEDRVSCDRYEELVMQFDIKQSMLNQCATNLEAKKAELEALKITVINLQAQLGATDHANVKLCLGHVSFNCELQPRDSQHANELREGTQHATVCGDIAHELSRQHEELTDVHPQDTKETDALHASHQRNVAPVKAKIEVKHHEAVNHHNRSMEQQSAGKTADLYSKDQDARLEGILRCLSIDIDGEAAGPAKRL